jgi:hypothetical protein
MKVLYYTVDKHLHSYDPNDGIEETTGTKEVIAYTIENNKLEMFVQYHELDNEDSSEEQIKNYLDEINMDSTKVKLVQL